MGLKAKKNIVAAVTFIVVFLVFAGAAVTEYNSTELQEKKYADDQLNVVAARVEQILGSRILNAQGLIVYIRSRPDLSADEFTKFAEQLVPLEDPLFRNLACIKDTTIVFQYPLKGNEAALGRDLAKIEAQRDTVLKVKNSGEMRLTAPVDLVQGGRGIIARMPVIIREPTDGQKNYWGQISLVFDYDKTIDACGLNGLSSDYRVRIVERDEVTQDAHTIWETPNFKPEEAISRDIKLSEVTWRVSLVPLAGWRGYSPSVSLLLLTGILFGAVLAMLLSNIINSKEEMELMVSERTRQLEETNLWLEQTMAEVEEKQAELTLVNEMLEDSLRDLRVTQRQLIISEKLAALGELVAGVAHEINTPLGIGVTLSSYLQKMHGELVKRFESNNMTRSDMKEYLQSSGEALELVVSNLERSSYLVASFKQVAVDQATLDLRYFNVKDYIQDTLSSLHPKFKNTSHRVEVECEDKLDIYSYPGALSQIVTNLVMNSLLHGFADMENGAIHIEVDAKDSHLTLTYADNGVGIPEESLSRVFNPFFTTRKAQGSTGLGLHIIHSIVTQTLKGTIALYSEPGKGVRVVIEFDVHPPEEDNV